MSGRRRASAAGLVLAVVVLGRLGVRHLVVYVIAAGLLWLAVFESGVQHTIWPAWP